MESSRFGVNASYVEALRAQWMQDPASVAEEWSRFFAEEGGAVVSAALGNGHGNGHVAPASTALPRNAESVLPQSVQVVERVEVRERRAPSLKKATSPRSCAASPPRSPRTCRCLSSCRRRCRRA